MKTIIVATDFSKEAENALEYTGALAKLSGSKVVIFNSYSLPLHTSNSVLPARSILKLEETNRLLLKERAENLGDKYGIKVEHQSGLFLVLEDELERIFKKYNAELVVMGMASSSIEQDIFGNTTTSVILQLKYPVLAVPLKATFQKSKNILFACENIEKVKKKVKQNVKDLARQLEAQIEIFHVEGSLQHKKMARTEKVIPDFEDVDYSYKSKNADSVIKAIEEEIRSFDAGMLVMIPQERGFWGSLLHRSKTRMMASGLSIPLLSLPQ
ncbi:MAG: universal stress protein [Salinimicrobium sp.]